MIINKVNIPKQPRSKKHLGSSTLTSRRTVAETIIEGGATGGSAQPEPCPFSVEVVSDTEYPIV